MGTIPKINRPASPIPGGEVQGTVVSEVTSPTYTAPGPAGPKTQWEGPSGQIDLSEAPPPWELEPERPGSDARRFVDVPTEWSLRWINPKLLESSGWRYWQPVMASDPRVRVKVPSLIAPDNLVRRGGDTGDILAWMPTQWVEKRRVQKDARARQQTRGAVEKQQQLKEDFARGQYGPHIRVEEATHPTHTMVEGKGLTD